MKRGRDDKINFRQYGPAAAALRKGHVFRDNREAKEQITAEGILNDVVAMHRYYSIGSEQEGKEGAAQSVLLHNREELALYRQKKRAELEERVTRGYSAIGNWVKYGRWEAQQGNFERVRSVMERSLQFHSMNAHIWRDYAELEARHGNVEMARNVLKRGVGLLPASVDLWLKYALLEQAAGRMDLARKVFRDWVRTSDPPACAFELYVLFEAQLADLPRSVTNPNQSGFGTSTSLVLHTGAEEEDSIDGQGSTSSSVALVGGVEDNCRVILKKYVEMIHSPEAWLFYASVEENVLKDLPRAIRVLQTAVEVLPKEVLFGPEECRIPLVCADLLSKAEDVTQARHVYHRLLTEVTDPKCAEEVLLCYRRFERLHAQCVEDAEYVTYLEAKKRYEKLLHANPADYDTALCLYALLATERQRLERTRAFGLPMEVQGSGVENPVADATRVPQKLSSILKESVETLRRVVSRLPPPSDLMRSQQHAVLLSEFTKVAIRHAAAAGSDTGVGQELQQEARGLLASTIKQFPFERASCPQIWLDAAVLEEEVFQNPTQARRLLQAGFHVTKELSLLNALLGVENRIYQRDLQVAAAQEDAAARTEAAAAALREYVQGMRKGFEMAIQAAPLESARWHRYAKWEEGEAASKSKKRSSKTVQPSPYVVLPSTAAGRARAAVLYRSCTQALNAEAIKNSLSLAQRYALLREVDETWGRLMAMERRELRRRLQQLRSASIASSSSDYDTVVREVQEAANRLQRVCEELLADVMAAYRFEALAWYLSVKEQQGDGVLSGLPPASLPEILKPAMARLAEACDAVEQGLLREVAPALLTAANRGPPPKDEEPQTQMPQEVLGRGLIRQTFQALLDQQRADLLQVLLAGSRESYEDTKVATAWREMLLGPLLHEWARYEASEGGQLDAVAAAGREGHAAVVGESGQRRRTRLFQKRK